MREIICPVCGKKAIDKSSLQNKMFCSRLCLNRYHDRKRSKPVEKVCQHNAWVLCMDKQCDRCGWNPVVEQARKGNK